jgi:AcrR family transcriptional regulator
VTGRAALTLGRVADELGVTTMALYRYVPGKKNSST